MVPSIGDPAVCTLSGIWSERRGMLLPVRYCFSGWGWPESARSAEAHAARMKAAAASRARFFEFMVIRAGFECAS